MISIDYDKQTYNTVAGLQAEVTAAQAAADIAKAASDALNQRLSSFQVELGVAQARRQTAASDQAAADAAEKSVGDSLLEALKACRQAVVIYANARSVLALADAAAQQTLTAGYDVAETLSYVTTASAKNSYITRKLLAAAEQADADASAAVSAAVDALRDAATAFIATERATGASFLVVASLINLQMLMSGYSKPARSNEDELPSALLSVPALNLAAAPAVPGRLDPGTIRSVDVFVLEQLPELISSATLASYSKELSPSSDLLAFTVDNYMKSINGTRLMMMSAGPSSAPLSADPGLQPGFTRVHDTALAYETEIQDATTLTQQAATEAAQDLARKAARLATAQAALAAAQQAAAT